MILFLVWPEDELIGREDTVGKNGAFKISGSAFDFISDIDPYMLIRHQCAIKSSENVGFFSKENYL